MAKPISHLLEIYDAWLHLATDGGSWRKLRKRYDCLPESPNALGLVQAFVDTESNGQHHLAIFIDRKAHDNPSLLVGTVAHEAAHAGCFILDHVEQDYDGKSEALAYLVGWIATWAWDRLQGGDHGAPSSEA